MARKSCPKCNQTYDPTAKFCPIDGSPLRTTNNHIDRFLNSILDGKYKIDNLIGKGAMGNVYSGSHLHIGVPVAIKILHPHLISDETSVERFRREARSALAVNHPNAMSVMDFGITDNNNTFYLVMELIPGVSLFDVIEQEGALEALRAVSIIKQVSMAVGAAHNKMIVHRDLKPDNILIIDQNTPYEVAKVIDFSIAKIYTDGVSEHSSLTRGGIVLGTPEYLSPEQAQGHKIDHRSDIYSLGIILYQMLTGRVPFTATTATTILMKHVEEQPMPLRQLKRDIPKEIEWVVLRALSKRPEQRPQNTMFFVEDLDRALVSANLTAPEMVEQPVPVVSGSAQAALPRNNVAKRSPGDLEDGSGSNLWDRLFRR